jgi:hypothetical protein
MRRCVAGREIGVAGPKSRVRSMVKTGGEMEKGGEID